MKTLPPESDNLPPKNDHFAPNLNLLQNVDNFVHGLLVRLSHKSSKEHASVVAVGEVSLDGLHSKNIFRSESTSCTNFGWFVRPVRKKNLDHLYTGIYAL